MSEGCGHTCRCMHDPASAPRGGLMVQTNAPSVLPRFRVLFNEDDTREDVFRVDAGQIDELRALLPMLSEIERGSIRAVPICDAGQHDPWDAAPIADVLLRLETEWLTDAMSEDALRFHYQPIVDAYHLRTFANEALVRTSIGDAPVSPADLLQAAKAHNALLTLDQRMRSRAITSSAEYLQGGGLLFVNFIPATIYDPEVCLRTTFRAAQSVGVGLDRVVFEIVESEAFPDVDHLRRIVDTYRARGAGVALDDLGAGNTALLFIDTLHPDYIKIDRELLRRSVESNETALFTGIVRHAQDRGIRVIAEGIENEQQLDFCRELGVQYAQGYHIARPAADPVRVDSDLRQNSAA